MLKNSPLKRLICLATAKPCAAICALTVLSLFWMAVPAPAWAALPNSFDDVGDKSASLIFGLFLGVMVTASAYLFFIWVVMRDKGQVFLLFLLVCLSINIASTNNLLMNQVGLFLPTTRELLTSYSMIFSCIFSVFFTYYFLEVEVNSPAFRMPLFALSGLFVGLLIASMFDLGQVRFALPALSTLTIAVVLGAGTAGLRQGVSGSFTHIIAFTFFLAGALAEPLYNLGYIVSAKSSQNLTYMAYSMAALMFAIVIASQFAARQEEKEKALATSNERFALATRGANEGLFDWNLETGDVFFSDQFRKIIGLRLENTTANLKMWIRLMVPSDRRIVREALRRFRRNPGINTINIEYRIAHGETRRWLHSKAVAMRHPLTRRIIRLVGSTSDITARKQSEVALRASEARFRSITEAHPVPVMIVSLRSQIVLYASPGAEQLLGSPQTKLLHDFIDRFIPDVDARQQILEAMSKGNEVNLKEVSIERGDGSKLDAALSARRISYQNEDAMVIGLYDLSERKRAEAQIARQQEALQQSEKMAALGGLLAGVAHELNNPLSVVVGQATLLMEGSPEPKIIARGEKIFKAADRCSRIVKSFLALARRKPPERKQIKLNEIVNSALELLGFQIRTGEIDIQLELDAELPEITGDGDQLTQVITNLVLNATQAMEGWQGKKRITIRSWHTQDHHVMLSVTDTGPGVPQDLRTRVFEPFFTTKSSKGGTGVGLSLCLNIVASHEGQMLLEDNPGGGASFIISLPMSEAAVEQQDPQSQASDVLPKNLKILLVDDEVEIAQTLADLLEPEGHYIDIAANGAIALEKLHKNAFDVIVSDLRMPVMDGPALYEALGRELPSYLGKIIYVTGDTLSSHVQSFLSEHPVPIVEKPYRLVDIRRGIANLLKQEATAPASLTSLETRASA
ncbi:MAG: ATP-binding protein [Alphaproteobacteria bacterium]